MFDLFNPAMREAKRRAKQEYRQRLMQGKMNALMREAQEKADADLQRRAHIRKNWPVWVRNALAIIVGLAVAAALSR